MRSQSGATSASPAQSQSMTMPPSFSQVNSEKVVSGSRMAADRSRPSAIKGCISATDCGRARKAAQRLPPSSPSSVVRWGGEPGADHPRWRSVARLQRPDPTVGPKRGAFPDTPYFCILLEKGIGGVPAGDAVSRDGVEEARRGETAGDIGVAEIMRQRQMGDQPALLRGEDGCDPRVDRMDQQQRRSLLADAGRQARMARDVCGGQAHDAHPRAWSGLDATGRRRYRTAALAIPIAPIGTRLHPVEPRLGRCCRPAVRCCERGLCDLPRDWKARRRVKVSNRSPRPLRQAAGNGQSGTLHQLS